MKRLGEKSHVWFFTQWVSYSSCREEIEGNSSLAVLLLWARFLLSSFLGGLQVEHKSWKGLNELVRKWIFQQYLLPFQHYGNGMCVTDWMALQRLEDIGKWYIINSIDVSFNGFETRLWDSFDFFHSTSPYRTSIFLRKMQSK